MPTSLWPQFIGDAYTARSQTIDAEDLINLFPETIQSSTNAKHMWLVGTPGLVSQAIAGSTSCRGMFWQDGRGFTVYGNQLYEISLSGLGPGLVVTLTQRGSAIANDGLPVWFASNGAGGNQLGISSGGSLYMFNLSTNTLSAAVTLPLTNAPTVLKFLNGYFLLVEKNTPKVWFSELENGSSWNGLDFFSRSNTSDYVIGMETLSDLVRVFGSVTCENYYNAGEADNPFLPYPGTLFMDGAIAQYGIGMQRDTVVWLSQNRNNVARFLQAGTGEPVAISTPAIEVALASYATVSDVELLVYEQEGHSFACWTFPTADVTWCYDAVEQKWHKRQGWNGVSCNFYRWRARGMCAPGSQVILVGDFVTGDVYTLNLDAFTDNGFTIKRLRRAPYLSAENQWLFLDQIELGMQAGVGNAAIANPSARLRISRDNGNTYTPTMSASLGASGTNGARAIWRRLGRVRADRLVIEISMVDPARAVLGPGLWLRASPGNGKL